MNELLTNAANHWPMLLLLAGLLAWPVEAYRRRERAVRDAETADEQPVSAFDAPLTSITNWPIDTGLEYGPHFDMTPLPNYEG